LDWIEAAAVPVTLRCIVASATAVPYHGLPDHNDMTGRGKRTGRKDKINQQERQP
jgi:hypothetical protein